MRVILIDDVFELGKRGDLVRVADGYGRNYLIPKKLAIAATEGNQKMIDQQRLALAKKATTYREEAELLARELDQLHLILSRKCGETGTLFGSVTSKELALLLKQTGIELDRRKVVMNQPIKRIGNFRIELRLHNEVATEVLLSVLAEGAQPMAVVKKKDEESEKIISELDAKLREIQQQEGQRLSESATVAAPPAEERPFAEEKVSEEPSQTGEASEKEE